MGSISIKKKYFSKIQQLKKNNQLYIFSNNKNYKRNIRIAKKINIEYLKTDYHKPSKKIIENLSISNNLIIIGDKILTDGLFARHIGATFIKVERYKSKKDRLITKIIYRLDDLCQYLLS